MQKIGSIATSLLMANACLASTPALQPISSAYDVNNCPGLEAVVQNGINFGTIVSKSAETHILTSSDINAATLNIQNQILASGTQNIRRNDQRFIAIEIPKQTFKFYRLQGGGETTALSLSNLKIGGPVKNFNPDNIRLSAQGNLSNIKISGTLNSKLTLTPGDYRTDIAVDLVCNPQTTQRRIERFLVPAKVKAIASIDIDGARGTINFGHFIAYTADKKIISPNSGTDSAQFSISAEPRSNIAVKLEKNKIKLCKEGTSHCTITVNKFKFAGQGVKVKRKKITINLPRSGKTVLKIGAQAKTTKKTKPGKYTATMQLTFSYI